MPNAVILFSHGSVLCGAGEALKHHAGRLRDLELAPIVEIGYLNYSEPLFADTVDRCVSQGTTSFTVAPYFLAPGYFVEVELPKCLDSARRRHPDVHFIAAETIGFDERLADAVIEAAKQPLNRVQWRDDLIEAPRHCVANRACPLYGSDPCPAGKYEHVLTQPVCVQSVGAADSGSMPALLVMAHGSPNPIANDPMLHVAEVIRRQSIFSMVEIGFLECNQPSIPEAIDACIARGGASIFAVPYFLHTGMHVADDIPTLIEEAERKHPDVSFALGGYLGQFPLVTAVLADRIRAVQSYKPH
jgi:sirohydrochlorin cobaltochelatase